MFITRKNQNIRSGRVWPNIKIRCPKCGNHGTFENSNFTDLYLSKDKLFLGHRFCPNDLCECHIFIISTPEGKIIKTYPPLRIDFNKDNIPSNVTKAFDEALICHSNECYVAAGILIRKTIEEICLEKGVRGKLREKIKNLGNKIIIPPELLKGMENLKLLGDDCAHVKSKTFDKIEREEIEVSIEFTKELLKALYQYENLLNRLEALKKT